MIDLYKKIYIQMKFLLIKTYVVVVVLPGHKGTVVLSTINVIQY